MKCFDRLFVNLVRFSCLFLFVALLSGCAEEKVSGTTQGVEVSQTDEQQEMVSEPMDEEHSAEYDVKRRVYEHSKEGVQIIYPEVLGLKGELSQDYMNQSLRAAVEIYALDEEMVSLRIDYSVETMNEELLSVLLTGQGLDREGREIVIRESVNLDIKSSNEIHLGNLVKDDAASQATFLDRLESYGFETTERLAIYFDGNHIVFFKRGIETEHRVLEETRVPFEDFLPLVSEDFDPKPAS